MLARRHTYRVTTEWIGNRGHGTADHAAYDRDHVITATGKPPIAGSSDPAFRGDPTRWNPEDLLLASISACHKLWYLGLCAKAGILVGSYRDDADAVMTEDADGRGRFIRAILRPKITISVGSDIAEATRLHHEAHDYCFIASSLNFPVVCEPVIVTMADSTAHGAAHDADLHRSSA